MILVKQEDFVLSEFKVRWKCFEFQIHVNVQYVLRFCVQIGRNFMYRRMKNEMEEENICCNLLYYLIPISFSALTCTGIGHL